MKSSACKYVLDRLSKIEKKYAKPLERKNEVDYLSQDEDDDEEHFISKSIKGSDKTMNSRSNPKYNAGILASAKNIQTLNITVPESDGKIISKYTGNILQEFPEAMDSQVFASKQLPSTRPNSDLKCSKTEGEQKSETKCSSEEFDLSMQKDVKYQHDQMMTKSLSENFERDKSIFSNVHLSTNSFVLKEQRSETDVQKKKNQANVIESEVKRNRLQMKLNLKLLDDPEETEITSKSTTSLSLQNSSGMENVPFRIFTFEDLIAEEELHPNDGNLKYPLDEQKSLDQLSCEFDRTSPVGSLIMGGSSYSEEIFTNEQLHEKPDDLSDTRHTEEILTDLENDTQSSIKESIKVDLENSLNKMDNKLPEFFISGEEVLYPGTNADEVNESKGEYNNEDRRENSKLIHFEDIQPPKQSISHIGLDNIKNISLQESERGESLGCGVIKHKTGNKCDYKKSNKKHSDAILKFKSVECNLEKLKDSTDLKTKTKKHYRVEKELKNQIKSIVELEGVLPGDLHHVSTQTENFLLSDTYEFEKRMNNIMKSSFNSMTYVPNLQLDVNKVFGGESSTSATLSPIERGFHCALKQQVELTKSFICAEYNMYAICMAAIKEVSASYKPATLHYKKKVI